MKNIQLEWAEGVKLLKGEDKTLVANINNAKGMFVSNECIHIIQTAFENKLSLSEVLSSICDIQSKEYF